MWAWRFKLLVNGAWADSPEQLQVINPANETVLTTCRRATPDLLNQAVAAAKRARAPWSGVPVSERAAVLRRLADRIEARKEEIAQVLTLEQGKPIASARDEVGYAALFCRHFAEIRFEPAVVQDDAAQRVEVHRKPLGAVGAIAPWNFPVLQAAYKVAPALLTCNTVVFKPAPTTPLAALFLGELRADLVPAGVVNVITDGGDIGPLLTSHPDVAYISFTGSTVVGKAVMASAAPTLRRLTLELGGNDAAIVLDDVDVKEVAT
jgi:acyl-CoA reductase-like NAD-dependent aldehyde dehydrogenase